MRVGPPELAADDHLAGRRYVEDRDTLDVVSGSRDAEVRFTERWLLALGDGPAPWRIAARGAGSPSRG